VDSGHAPRSAFAKYRESGHARDRNAEEIRPKSMPTLNDTTKLIDLGKNYPGLQKSVCRAKKRAITCFISRE